MTGYEKARSLLEISEEFSLSKNVKIFLCGDLGVKFEVRINRIEWYGFMSMSPTTASIFIPDPDDYEVGDITQAKESEIEEAINGFVPICAFVKNGVAWGVKKFAIERGCGPYCINLVSAYVCFAECKRPTKKDIGRAIRTQTMLAFADNQRELSSVED